MRGYEVPRPMEPFGAGCLGHEGLSPPAPCNCKSGSLRLVAHHIYRVSQAVPGPDGLGTELQGGGALFGLHLWVGGTMCRLDPKVSINFHLF